MIGNHNISLHLSQLNHEQRDRLRIHLRYCNQIRYRLQLGSGGTAVPAESKRRTLKVKKLAAA
jgi:hypothetical protein